MRTFKYFFFLSHEQVGSWTLLMGIISFIRLAITAMFRDQGGKSLVWIGVVTQLGSFVGAITMFFLVQYTTIFSTYTPTCNATL